MPKEKKIPPPLQKNSTEEIIVGVIEVAEVAEVEDFLAVDVSHREEVAVVMHSLPKDGCQKDKYSTKKTKNKINKLLTGLTKNKSSLQLISTKNGISKKIMEVTLESLSIKRKEMIMWDLSSRSIQIQMLNSRINGGTFTKREKNQYI